MPMAVKNDSPARYQLNSLLILTVGLLLKIAMLSNL
jgi:hypothetical protein